MDWYDTYQNTKINYWLIDFLFAIGPLIYFYIKCLTQPYFRFRKIDWLHFAPAILFFVYKVFIFIYDSQQPGFEDVQNGWFLTNIHYQYVSNIIGPLKDISFIVYSFFAVKTYWHHRKYIVEYFSNTYNVELNWLRNFLVIFIGLYIFHQIVYLFDYSFFDNFWKQRWWGNLANALAMLYVGMMSYFSDLTKLQNLQPLETSTSSENPPLKNIEERSESSEFENQKRKISSYMETHQPFLNPEITLPELAKELKLSSNLLSQIINSGFDKNFNEFINEFRVEMVKTKLQDESLQHLSLLGIALECGFNSKATFNRVFKKLTNQSPSQFQKSIKS